MTDRRCGVDYPCPNGQHDIGRETGAGVNDPGPSSNGREVDADRMRGATFFPGSDPVADGVRRANALLDPRKRALVAVRNMAADWYCPFDDERQRIDCPECVATVALDAYEGVQRLDHGITS